MPENAAQCIWLVGELYQKPPWRLATGLLAAGRDFSAIRCIHSCVVDGISHSGGVGQKITGSILAGRPEQATMNDGPVYEKITT